ncbi:hypothetical protein JHK87_012179 [Glycine soja]|nr:hypothetical protein JHK87_012179 [Glycine soja]
MLLCCIRCFLLINVIFIRGCTKTISTNLWLFLLYQFNIFPFTFAFVNYTVIYKTKVERKYIELVDEEEPRKDPDCSSVASNKSEIYNEEAGNAAQKHKPKRVESVNADAEAFGHQSVSLENKTGDSIVLKIGDSAKFVIKQDMKGGEHKYGFNNNKREKPQKVRLVDDETGNKHELFDCSYIELYKYWVLGFL